MTMSVPERNSGSEEKEEESEDESEIVEESPCGRWQKRKEQVPAADTCHSLIVSQNLPNCLNNLLAIINVLVFNMMPRNAHYDAEVDRAL